MPSAAAPSLRRLDRIVSGRMPGKLTHSVLVRPRRAARNLADFRDRYERNAKIRSMDRTSGCGGTHVRSARAGSAWALSLLLMGAAWCHVGATIRVES